MKFSNYIAAAAAIATPALAGPIKRNAPAITDAGILNFALTLEHLEDKFYREGLANYTEAQFAEAGFDSAFYANLKEVSYDETTHVSFLTSALKAAGATPVQECTYAFGVADVKSFITLASVLEGVGVTAYLGAAGLISSKAYLTAAGSILTVEARHTSYLRAALGLHPVPQAFDVPLDYNEVYTLAKPFIVSCPPSNPAFLPLQAFPALTVTSTGTVLTGSTINVSAAGVSGTVYASFVTVTGPVWAKATPCDGGYQVVIPAGVHGQSYLVLSTSPSAANDSNIVAGPAIVMISGQDGNPTAP